MNTNYFLLKGRIWLALSGESDGGKYSSEGHEQEDDSAPFHGVPMLDKGMKDQFESIAA